MNRFLAVSIGVVLLAGCSTGGEFMGDKKGPDITLQEAADRAEKFFLGHSEKFGQQFIPTHGEITIGSCDLTRRRVVMTILSEDRMGNFLGVVERYWRKSGYAINAVNSDKEFPAIFAQSADGFGITLVIGKKRQAFFDVDTPCVKRSEVAEPTSKANGPDYRGGPIPRPNVHSDFWSAANSGPCRREPPDPASPRLH